MKASIICVGTELVTGRTKESNSYYLAEELRQYGIYTHHKIIVEDQLSQMVPLMELALKTSDFVFVTGGLGPTLDDLTREAVAELTGFPLELQEEEKEKIIKLVSNYQKGCPVNNYRQAYIPKGSLILPNNNGTAPGFITSVGEKKIIVLPGPPREMSAMFRESVVPIIKDLSPVVFVKKTFQTFGLGESALEELVEDLFINQENPSLGTYASLGTVTLVLTAQGENEAEGEDVLAPFVEEIRRRVGEYIYSEAGESLQGIVQRRLTERNLTLSVAESCTGGGLAARLTALAGVSSVFEGGFVTYSNEMKLKVLGVPEEVLSQHGAVSEETALAMLRGLKEKTGSHCGISITGIAGPGGATLHKPVGLVYIGINVLEDYKVYQFNFRGDRERIQNLTIVRALDLLRRSL